MKNLVCTSMMVTLTLILILLISCSRIEIESPAKEEPNLTTPYTLIVKHNGCGTVNQESFKAWLNKDKDNALEITNAFSYAQNTWTASDYDLPMGNHTLWVHAEVNTGAWCYETQSSDTRNIFVAPCTDFETAWGTDFDFDPDTLTIFYGTDTLKIAQGETGHIQLPENSPLIVDGKLPAIVKYGIRNITDKNLKVGVMLRHGQAFLYSKDLAFCGQVLVEEEQAVSFSASPEPLNIVVEAGDIFSSPSDDTRAVFFNGKLQVRVYPL